MVSNTGLTVLSDILECANNSSGCDFTCVELPGGYKCECDVGYDLFTEDGLHGYMIPDSENGLLAGDLYRINHTCVSKYFRLVLNLFKTTNFRLI